MKNFRPKECLCNMSFRCLSFHWKILCTMNKQLLREYVSAFIPACFFFNYFPSILKRKDFIIKMLIINKETLIENILRKGNSSTVRTTSEKCLSFFLSQYNSFVLAISRTIFSISHQQKSR